MLKLGMTLGQIIRDARKEKKWSLRQLADEMGKEGAEIDFTYLSRVENNASEYPLSEKKIRVLARVLGLNEQELVFAADKVPVEDVIKAMKDPEFKAAFFRSIKK